jgi:hypothetical protein
VTDWRATSPHPVTTGGSIRKWYSSSGKIKAGSAGNDTSGPTSARRVPGPRKVKNGRPLGVQNRSQQLLKEFQQLGQDLQSGNLSAAQADFTTCNSRRRELLRHRAATQLPNNSISFRKT